MLYHKLGNFNFPLVSKKNPQNFDFFKTKGKLEIYESKKSHHIVDLDELILKMYTVLRLEIAFHK